MIKVELKELIAEAKAIGGFYAEHTSPANGGIRLNGEKYISVGYFLTPGKPLSVSIIEEDMKGVNGDMILYFTPFQRVGEKPPKTWRGTLNELISAMK